VAVVGAGDQRHASRQGGDRLAELEVLLEWPVAGRRDDDDLRRLDEAQWDLRAPVDRELRGRGVVGAVRDAEDRQRSREQHFGGGAIGLVLAHRARGHDGVVAVDVDRMRRDDDRHVRLVRGEATAELLHRRP
jgi:hypothetical protein